MKEKLLKIIKALLRPLSVFFTFDIEGNHFFSTKKFYAFIFSLIGIINYSILLLKPEIHWSVILSAHAVDAIVITTIHASLDVLILGSLAIYGWAKIKGAE
jgi:hypothetical protein